MRAYKDISTNDELIISPRQYIEILVRFLEKQGMYKKEDYLIDTPIPSEYIVIVIPENGSIYQISANKFVEKLYLGLLKEIN